MNAYKIETERLIIRCYEPKDAQKLKLAIDESIEHLSPWMPWAKNEPETIEQKVKSIFMQCRSVLMVGETHAEILSSEGGAHFETSILDIDNVPLKVEIGHKIDRVRSFVNSSLIGIAEAAGLMRKIDKTKP